MRLSGVPQWHGLYRYTSIKWENYMTVDSKISRIKYQT